MDYKNLLINIYSLLSTFVIIVPVFIYFKRKNRIELKELLLPVVYCLYFFFIFKYTNSGTIYDLRRYGIDFKNVNLIPFSHDIDVVVYIYNVLMFIPLGILLPLIWERMRNCKSIAFVSLLSSFLIEISQLVNNRVTDIDDLILNTIGGIIGYLIFKLLVKKSNIKFLNKKRDSILSPMFIFVILIVSRAVFFNEFSLAKILYRF